MGKQRWLPVLLTITAVLLAGCRVGRAPAPGGGAPPGPGAPPEAGQEAPAAPAEPQKRTVTVYFADSQAMYLRPAQRQVPADRPAAGIVEALLAGPTAEEQDLRRTIPARARLRGISIHGGVANVDFTEELQKEFWGGSTGEMMLIFSVVNSLTELPEIKSVRFMMEGKPLETLGHADLTEPIARREDLIQR